MARREVKEDRDAVRLKERPTYVYVLRSEGRLKIGIAGDVQLRIRQLQNGSGARVLFIASRQFSTRLSAEAVEAKLHKRYQKDRLHGEWFNVHPDRVVAALERIKDPELHSADWFPGMPPEIATSDAFTRWEWRADNGIRAIEDFVHRFGERQGPIKYRQQVPKPGQWK